MDDNSPIDLNPQPQDQIDLSAPETPTLPASTMRDRAERYSYAAGQDSPGPATVYSQIQSGREADLRNYLSEKEDIKNEFVRNEMLKEILASKGGKPLTDSEYSFFTTLTQQQISNPDLILEELQAKRVIADTAHRADLIHMARAEDPGVSNVIQDVAEQTLTKRQITQKMIEDVQGTQNSEGKLKTAADWATYIVGSSVPFLYQWAMHNNVQEPFSSSYLTGKNKIEQYAFLMSLPPAEFYKRVKAVTDDLYRKSPQFAIDFLSGLQSYSQSDSFLDNALNVADLAVVVSPAVRGLVRAGKAARGTKAIEGAEFSDKSLEEALGKTVKTSPDKSVSLEQAVGEMYGTKRPSEIAKTLGVTDEEVTRIIDYFESSPFRSDVPGAKDYLGDFGKPPKINDQLPVELTHAGRFGESMKQIVKSVDPARPDIKEVASAAGRQEEASLAHVVDKMRSLSVPEDDFAQMKSLVSSIPSFGDPGLAFRGAFKLMREQADQIVDELKTIQAGLTRALSFGVDALPQKALQQAYELARGQIKEYVAKKGLNDAVLDLDWHPLDIRPEDTKGNVGMAVLRLGRPGGELFHSDVEAKNFIHEYGLKDATVKSTGDKFVIQVSQTVDESRQELKDILVDTTNKTPQSRFTTLIDGIWAGSGKFRTPSEVLSTDLTGVRAKLVNELAELSRLDQLAGETISSLPKSSRQSLSRFMSALGRYEDTLDDGTRVKGLELSDQGQFEILWSGMFKTLPTAQESNAYWKLVNINQYDYVLKNLYVYHFQARQGIRSWVPEKAGEAFDGKLIVNPKLDDILEKRGNILFINQNTGEKKLYLAKQMARSNKKLLKTVEGLIKDEGYQLIQRVDPNMDGWKSPVHFVLTATAESENLPYRRLPYRGGGHQIWDYPNFLKQPKLFHSQDGRTYFSGDNTLWGFTAGRESEGVAKAVNTAREMFRRGEFDNFDKFVRENTPFDPEALFNKFKNRTLDPETPIVSVRAGESTMSHPTFQELLRGDFEAWQDSPLNLLRDMNKEFLGHRGWDPKGVLADEQAPVFEMAKPRLIDPLPMASQALNRVTRTKMLEPYKLRAAEHFVEEFHPVMKNGIADIQKLRDNPIAALYNPQWDKNTQNRELLAAGRTFQYHAKQLIGTSTEFGQFQNWLRTKLIDSVYTRLGKSAAERVYENLWMIPDPIKFARQVAFHSKLGLFNPVQLWLQYQTFTNTLALSPTHAPAGLYGAILARMVGVKGFQVDTATLDHFAKLASGFGWRAEDWKEMYSFMHDSGVYNIGPQHAFRSDALDPAVFTSTAGRWLDKFSFFFTEGERGNHLAGFATAYREWRQANPLAKLDREAKQDILRRYDDLTVNMTHASSSALNRGLGATAGQFLSYQERLSELLLGRRLSRTEKVRALSIYAAMYGVPVAASSALAYPFYQEMREHVLPTGMQNNPFIEGMMQGLPELMMHYALGSEFAYGERYGPNGIQLFRDIRNGDVTFWQLLTGASQSIARDIFESSVPAVKDISDYIHGEGNNKVMLNDVLEVLKNTSTLSNAVKGYYALTTMKYMNQGQVVIDDQVNPQEAIMMGLFGIQPTRINDIQIMRDAMTHRTEGQSFARQQAKRYWRLGWRESDPDARKSYFKSAQTWMVIGDLNPIERQRLTAEAISEAETEGTTTRRSFDQTFPKE